MASPDVGQTARWTAAMRAIEQERPDALFKDPLAQVFAGDALQMLKPEFAQYGIREPHAHSHIAIRCRGMDDLISQELEDLMPTEAIQVVNIGAGMCTRAWRLQRPASKILWYEVDLPSSIQLKMQLVQQAQAKASVDALHMIPMDFGNPYASLAGALAGCQFDPSKPTVFVLEGVLMYLDHVQIDKLARDLAQMSSGPARVVMTCINEGFLQEIKNMNSANKQNFPGSAQIAHLLVSSWEGCTSQAFARAGWYNTSVTTRDAYALKLGVKMWTYPFPDPKTSTEQMIVMRKQDVMKPSPLSSNVLPMASLLCANSVAMGSNPLPLYVASR